MAPPVAYLDGTRHWLSFKYERMSVFCYSCGKLGHTVTACPDPQLQPLMEPNSPSALGPWMRTQTPRSGAPALLSSKSDGGTIPTAVGTPPTDSSQTASNQGIVLVLLSCTKFPIPEEGSPIHLTRLPLANILNSCPLSTFHSTLPSKKSHIQDLSPTPSTTTPTSLHYTSKPTFQPTPSFSSPFLKIEPNNNSPLSTNSNPFLEPNLMPLSVTSPLLHTQRKPNRRISQVTQSKHAVGESGIPEIFPNLHIFTCPQLSECDEQSAPTADTLLTEVRRRVLHIKSAARTLGEPRNQVFLQVEFSTVDDRNLHLSEAEEAGHNMPPTVL